MWIGNPDAESWWLLLSYSEPRSLQDIEVILTDQSAPAYPFFVSLDASAWEDLESLLTGDWVFFKYLWIFFAADPTHVIPEVKEVIVK